MNMPNSPKTIAPTTPCKALVPHSARRCTPASSSGSSADSNDVPVLFNQKFNWKMPKGVPKEPKSRSENARWPIQNERLLIEFMHEEFLQGQLLTSTFSSYVWGNICGRLNEVLEKTTYNVEQCKSKYRRIRRDWRFFHGLLTKETGLGWDPDKNTITGDNERIAAIVKEHPDNAATIERGLPHYNYCTDMFASNVATGSMARSSMQPPVESDEEGQVDPLGQNSDSRTRSREWGEEESYTPLNSQGPNRFSTTSSRNEPHEYSTSSSRRKKTKNLTDKDDVLISSLQKWDAFLDAKTASLGPPVIEVVQKCVASLRAMEDLPESLFNKAIKELKSDTPTRAFFLELNQREKRSWVESLGHP